MTTNPPRTNRTRAPLDGVASATPAESVIPAENHPMWGLLIEGQVRHDFNYAAAGMLLFNLNLQWRRDPKRLPELIQKARAFFGKYQHLLLADIERLFTQE